MSSGRDTKHTCGFSSWMAFTRPAQDQSSQHSSRWDGGQGGGGVEAHEPQQLAEESMASGGEIVHFKAVALRMPIMLQWMAQHL